LQIPENKKREFAEKQITCVEYRDLPDGVERDIFQRVQLGVALTNAEKAQAIDSNWSQWIHSLNNKYVHQEDGFPAYIKWDTKRGRDFQCVGMLVMLCYALPGHTIPSIQRLITFLQNAESPDGSFVQHIEEIFSLFLNLVSDEKYKSVFDDYTKLAPVEFMYIGVLIAKLRRPSLDVLAAKVKEMRRYIRGEFRDIRLNNVVCKKLFEFIDGMRVQSWPATPWNKDSNDDVLIRGAKRKRGGRGDQRDEDEDFRPSISSLRPNPRKVRR